MTTEKMLIDEIMLQYKPIQIVHLATVDGDSPRVRPMAMIVFENRLFIATGTSSNKVNQLKRNTAFEFCMALKDGENEGYLRGRGKAKILTDPQIKKTLSEKMPFFAQYWKSPDDPTYTLVELNVSEYDYTRPAEYEVHHVIV